MQTNLLVCSKLSGGFLYGCEQTPQTVLISRPENQRVSSLPLTPRCHAFKPFVTRDCFFFLCVVRCSWTPQGCTNPALNTPPPPCQDSLLGYFLRRSQVETCVINFWKVFSERGLALSRSWASGLREDPDPTPPPPPEPPGLPGTFCPGQALRGLTCRFESRRQREP